MAPRSEINTMDFLMFQESRWLLHSEGKFHNKLGCQTLKYAVWGNMCSGCNQICKRYCSGDMYFWHEVEWGDF